MTKTKNTKVYEDLRQEFLKLYDAERDKTDKARAKIDEANEQIERNKVLMEEATKNGDLDKYAELKADTAKNNEIIKFFTGVLESTKRNACIDPGQANRMYAAADKEIAALKNKYNKDMVEALRPIIEMSNEAFLQIKLLEMAKSKIKKCLEHSNDIIASTFLENMHVMTSLDKLLQCDDYKRYNPDVKGDAKHAFRRYEWQDPAKAKLAEESARW